MKKSLIILLIFVSLLTFGCSSKKKIDKFYLDDKYYGSSEFIEITSDELESLKGKYILFTYNNFCALSIPCDEIFLKFMEENNIAILSIPFTQFQNTYLYDEVKYGPSVLIVNDKEVVAYLDAEDDDDLDKYQNVEIFQKWISDYIYLNKE